MEKLRANYVQIFNHTVAMSLIIHGFIVLLYFKSNQNLQNEHCAVINKTHHFIFPELSVAYESPFPPLENKNKKNKYP